MVATFSSVNTYQAPLANFERRFLHLISILPRCSLAYLHSKLAWILDRRDQQRGSIFSHSASQQVSQHLLMQTSEIAERFKKDGDLSNIRPMLN